MSLSVGGAERSQPRAGAGLGFNWPDHPAAYLCWIGAAHAQASQPAPRHTEASHPAEDV